MLYIVPSGANDDWYWIYATVNANRKSAAYVVRICSTATLLLLLPLLIIILILFHILFQIFHLLVLVPQIHVLLFLIFVPHLSYHYQSYLLFLSPHHSPPPPPLPL